MAKYSARFENFFLNLRLNRAEFAEMAAFTLNALRTSANAKQYQDLIDLLEAALKAYRKLHGEQLSGERQEATLTLGQARADLKAYAKRVERKHAAPAYDEGSPDWVALSPQGRAALTRGPQDKVLDQFAPFLDALDARADVFPDKVRAEGRQALKNYQTALGQAATADHSADTRRLDLHDGREATCTALFRAYAALLLEHFEDPKKVSAFFDLSKALVSKPKGRAKPPKSLQQ